MKRRDFVKNGLKGAAVAALGPVLTQRANAAGGPPNILVVFVDEMRHPAWIPETYQKAFLPNLHRLWSESARFDNHFTAAADCSPSRASFVTGLYGHQHFVLTTMQAVGPALQVGLPTYGTALRAKGYDTRWFGKWHLNNAPHTCAGDGSLDDYGFNNASLCPDPGGVPHQGENLDPTIARQFTDWLQARPVAEGPWCSTVSLINPHDIQWFWNGTDCLGSTQANPPSYWMTDQYFASLGNYPCDNFENLPAGNSGKPSLQSQFISNFTNQTFGSISTDVNTRKPVMPPVDCSDMAVMKPFNYWYKMLRLYMDLHVKLDVEIGKIMNAVRSSAFASNTVVIFTSDHGEYGGAHGMRGKGGGAYEEAMKIPLFVWDPSGRFVKSPGVARTGLTSSVDVMPLLMTLAANGSTADWKTDEDYSHLARRLDLAAMLRDPSAPGRSYVLYSTDEFYGPITAPQHVVTYRTAQAKLSAYVDWRPGTVAIDPQGRQELEVYDYRGGDFRELNNVAGSNAMTLSLYRALMGIGGAFGSELRAPLPSSLASAQTAAIAAYLAYLRSKA